MEKARFLECMAADYSRIRDIVPGHLEAEVPTCPGWTVGDLTRHLAVVYLHKVAILREGRPPQEWPPAEVADLEPVGLLERAYGELVRELTSRQPEDASYTWYVPDQTVGFWVRRMAQETVVHRIDAEIGVGLPVTPIPDDLAVDGIDELLRVFVEFAVGEWPEDFLQEWPKDPMGAPVHFPRRTYAIGTDGAYWFVEASPGHFAVAGGPGADVVDGGTPNVVVQGAPGAVLRWAWNRQMADGQDAVAFDGDPNALSDLRQFVVIATQ